MKWIYAFSNGKGINLPKIVSMSGNSTNDQKKFYNDFMINAFLQKPIRRRSLIGTVKIL